MKKALSLILMLVLCLSLCACGNGTNNEAEKIAEAYERKTLYTKERYDDTPGSFKMIQDVLEFKSDGVGKIYTRSRNSGGTKWTDYNMSSFTWEVKGNYIHISYSGSEKIFKVEIVGESLQNVADGKMYSVNNKNQ